jgi:peptide/nickel transport system ATP-binding protein
MPLEAKNIGFRYGSGDWILREFDFTLNQGEIVGLVGNSGCGKTTFAKILSGYEKANKGTVFVDSAILPTCGYNPVQLVFQHPEKSVNPRWTMNKILNEGWSADKNILKALGIENEWLSRWPNELSGGELQRFCVARALGPQTKYLIADEMTTMLDAITQAQIWHVVLEEASRRNMGVLVVSHERELINKLCSRVIEFEAATKR